MVILSFEKLPNYQVPCSSLAVGEVQVLSAPLNERLVSVGRGSTSALDASCVTDERLHPHDTPAVGAHTETPPQQQHTLGFHICPLALPAAACLQAATTVTLADITARRKIACVCTCASACVRLCVCV